MIGEMIWNDSGTRARQNGSVWEIKPKDENGIPAHTFYSHNGHSKPDPDIAEVYVIAKRDGVTVVEATE